MRSLKLLILLVIFLGGLYYGYSAYFSGAPYVGIDGKAYSVEIATTADSRATGLMNRDSIGDKDGMLFVFDKPGIYAFWMKDVRFPLDIIWINNGEVVYIVESAEPSPQPPHKNYIPDRSANYVLELPGGTVFRDGIHIGSKVEINI